MWVFENAARQEGFSTIAGIDEAGRGPLAGPVVSAAVILPAALQIAGVDDSKRLTPKKRAALFGEIYRRAISVGVGVVGPGRIDEINILQASLKSMAMAVACLNPRPDCLLIDGIFKIESDISQTPIPKGDPGQYDGAVPPSIPAIRVCAAQRISHQGPQNCHPGARLHAHPPQEFQRGAGIYIKESF